MNFLKSWKPILITAVVVGFFALFYQAESIRDLYLPPCPFHVLTGMHCPGCGSTRALHKLVHGDVLSAVRFNPLTILATPVIIFLILRKDRTVLTAMPSWILIGIIITFGVLRNIPAYPFTLLQP